METAKAEPSVSYLLIRDADLADSGKYSCSPSNTGVSHIRVHVLNGKLASGYTRKSFKEFYLHIIKWLGQDAL